MSEEVEHACHVAKSLHIGIFFGHCHAAGLWVGQANAKCHEHETNLRDGREGQNALDVALYASHSCGIEGREGCDVGNPMQLFGGELYEDGEQTGHKEHACYNHRCGMDKRRYGCRAFHCIGQPNVQGEHGALTCTADEHEEQSYGHHYGRTCHLIVERRHGVEVVVERSYIETVNQDADKEEQVGKAGYDKCLLRCGNGSPLGVVETDEKIGRHTHKLPK